MRLSREVKAQHHEEITSVASSVSNIDTDYAPPRAKPKKLLGLGGLGASIANGKLPT